MSDHFVELDNEFALLAETAAEVGRPSGDIPKVQRHWVNPPTGGHVSALVWGTARPSTVLLHDAGQSARAWDAVVLAGGQPSVAIDLPGHGRSSWRRDGDYRPRKIAAGVAEAISSFAPDVRVVVGSGLGGLAAIALTLRHAELVPRLVLLDSLPGLPGRRPPSPVPFVPAEEAPAAVASGRLHRSALYELVRDATGDLAYRHHLGNLPTGTLDDPTLWEQLAALRVPVTLIVGADSTRVSPEQRAALGRGPGGSPPSGSRRPDVNVITVNGATNDVAAEQPAATAEAINSLIETLV